MIGGLIEQQEIRLSRPDPCQCKLCSLSSTEAVDVLCTPLV